MERWSGQDPMIDRRSLLALSAVRALASPGDSSGMREVPESKRFVVAREPGWYLGFTGMASTRDGHLVCSYLRTDQHLRTTTDIMIARSEDGGRTWKDHKSIGHL